MGEILWDVLPDSRKPGGAPFNVAYHLSRMENDVRIASRIGVDEKGKLLTGIMENAGLSTELVQHDPVLPTSEVLVSLDDDNNASFVIPSPVAWDNLELTDNLSAAATRAGVIIYGSLCSRGEFSRRSIIHALESSAVKIMDVNLRPPYTEKEIVKELLSFADVAKLNDEELLEIASWDGMNSGDPEAMMGWFTGKYKVQMVIVTRGARGAIVYDTENFFEHNGYKVSVQDTVGAGDAFLAGFVSSLVKGNKTGEALNFGCASGAFVASREGGTPVYDLKEIEEIIRA